MASIIRFKKLFIICFKIVNKNNNLFIKFTISIWNQQLFFTFIIPSSPKSNDNDSNGNKPPTLNRTFEFFNGIHVTKH